MTRGFLLMMQARETLRENPYNFYTNIKNITLAISPSKFHKILQKLKFLK